jgi:hypothetical protein
MAWGNKAKNPNHKFQTIRGKEKENKQQTKTKPNREKPATGL